jgi:hypothetical protein
MIKRAQGQEPITAKRIAKTAAATVATAAAATGATLLLAKSGKLDQFVGKNKVADKAINGAKSLADDIAKFAETKFAKVKPAFEKVAKKVKESKVVKAVSSFFGKAVDFVKTRLGKFNPDLAPAKEKMAETFNNFVK